MLHVECTWFLFLPDFLRLHLVKYSGGGLSHSTDSKIVQHENNVNKKIILDEAAAHYPAER